MYWITSHKLVLLLGLREIYTWYKWGVLFAVDVDNIRENWGRRQAESREKKRELGRLTGDHGHIINSYIALLWFSVRFNCPFCIIVAEHFIQHTSWANIELQMWAYDCCAIIAEKSYIETSKMIFCNMIVGFLETISELIQYWVLTTPTNSPAYHISYLCPFLAWSNTMNDFISSCRAPKTSRRI